MYTWEYFSLQNNRASKKNAYQFLVCEIGDNWIFKIENSPVS